MALYIQRTCELLISIAVFDCDFSAVSVRLMITSVISMLDTVRFNCSFDICMNCGTEE